MISTLATRIRAGRTAAQAGLQTLTMTSTWTQSAPLLRTLRTYGRRSSKRSAQDGHNRGRRENLTATAGLKERRTSSPNFEKLALRIEGATLHSGTVCHTLPIKIPARAAIALLGAGPELT